MRTFLRILSIVLLITWMGLIFFLSAQTADESSQTSGGIIQMIVEKVYPDFYDYTEARQNEIIESYQFIVRKATHIGIYFALGVFAFLTFVSYTRLRFWIRMLLPFGVGAVYAVTDECHQTFVAGRSGELRDLLLDSTGVLAAVLICSLFVKVIPALRRKTAYALANVKLAAEEFEENMESLNAEKTLPMIDVAFTVEEVARVNAESHEEKAEIIEEVKTVIWESSFENEQAKADIVESSFEENEKLKLSDEMQYAASVIGKAVIEVTKLCNKLTVGEQDETRKELVNLALGRTEVLKADILKILNMQISFEEKKDFIEKARRDAYDYFDSIIAQIS